MKKSYFQLHIAVMLLGFSGVFGKLISLNEGLLTWYRVVFSAIILFFWLKISDLSRDIGFRTKIKIGSLGLLISFSWMLFYASIKYSNISIGVICYCAASFFTAIFAPLLNKEKFKWSEIALSLLTIVGISFIFQFDVSYRIGIILGVIAPAFASLYTVCNEKWVRQFDSELVTYYQMIGGTVGLSILLPFYLIAFPVESVLPDLSDLVNLFILAFFCTVGAYVLLAKSLKKLSPFTINLSLNMEPIYAIVIAFLFFEEGNEVNIGFYIGVFLVMTTVALQALMASRSKHQKVDVV